MRKLVAVAVVLIAVACGTEAPPASLATSEPQGTASPQTEAPSTAPPTTTAPSAPSFSVEAAMEDVRALSVDIGLRNAGSDGDERAAIYIAEALRAASYEAEEQEFPLPQGGTSTNVIGYPTGFTTDRPYLIVGGHRDSLNGPGANDNATGIAASLEIVRSLAADPAPLPVMFVAFGAEEVQPVPGSVHHVGSLYHVEQMSAQARENLVAYVNLDMIGRGDVIYAGRMDVGPRDATERLVTTGDALGIDVRERVTPDWSDNGSFLREGMNAGWLWTGDDPCCVHTPQDTFDRVRPGDLERAGRVALATIHSYGSR